MDWRQLQVADGRQLGVESAKGLGHGCRGALLRAAEPVLQL